jgi:hypothetical protein
MEVQSAKYKVIDNANIVHKHFLYPKPAYDFVNTKLYRADSLTT